MGDEAEKRADGIDARTSVDDMSAEARAAEKRRRKRLAAKAKKREEVAKQVAEEEAKNRVVKEAQDKERRDQLLKPNLALANNVGSLLEQMKNPDLDASIEANSQKRLTEKELLARFMKPDETQDSDTDSDSTS